MKVIFLCLCIGLVESVITRTVYDPVTNSLKIVQETKDQKATDDIDADIAAKVGRQETRNRAKSGRQNRLTIVKDMTQLVRLELEDQRNAPPTSPPVQMPTPNPQPPTLAPTISPTTLDEGLREFMHAGSFSGNSSATPVPASGSASLSGPTTAPTMMPTPDKENVVMKNLLYNDAIKHAMALSQNSQVIWGRMHSAQDIVGCISAMLNITGFDVQTKDGTSNNDVDEGFNDKDKCDHIAVPSDIIAAKKETRLQMELRLGKTNAALAGRLKLDKIMAGYRKLISVAKLTGNRAAAKKFAIKLATLQVKLGMKVVRVHGKLKVVSDAQDAAHGGAATMAILNAAAQDIKDHQTRR
jgi:hypothetical protein